MDLERRDLLLPMGGVRMRVLVLAPRGRDAALICQVIEAAGMAAEACATLSELTSRMREGAAAALVAEEALAHGLSDFVSVLDSQPSWSDFPVILLAEAEHPPRVKDAMGHVLNSAAILRRPVAPETLVSVVRLELLSRRRQYQLQAYLATERQRAIEILENIYDGYLSIDCRWRCVYVNQRGASLLDCRPEDLIGANMLEIMPHWTTGTFRALVEGVMTTGKPFAVEEFCPITNRWLDVRCGASVDGLSFFFCDITQRKAAEEHLRLVINELGHRVKNTLAVIQVIADQTFKTGGDLESIRSAFQGRLKALAETHNLLTAAHWESVDLAALVDHAVGDLRGASCERVHAAGEALKLIPEASLAIGMTLHELYTNAVKYGALATETGSIDMRWRLNGDALIIDWQEQGGAEITPPARKGFGTAMIDQSIEYQLGGQVVREYRPDGLHCTLTVPLEAVRSA
jgi:two-component sensor histidine kinase